MVKRLKSTKEYFISCLNQKKEKKNFHNKDDKNEYFQKYDVINNKFKQIKTFEPLKNMKEEDKINIEFSSVNQIINNFSVLCKKDDKFTTLKNIIFNVYPFKNKNLFILVDGTIFEEMKTLKENKINNNDKLLIVDQGSFYY